MHTISLLAPIALIVATAFAQDVAPSFVSPERGAAWKAFQEKYGSFSVEWNRATGTPSGIWGDGIPLGIGPITDLELARREAAKLLARHVALLGTGESTWAESIANYTAPLHTLVYDQTFKGLKVVGGRADVRVHECGGVSYFGSSAFTIPRNLVLTPIVTPAEATLRAYASRNLEARLGPVLLPAPRVKLVLWGDCASPIAVEARLAWEVSVDELSQSTVGRAYIDATNGTFLKYETDLHYCAFDNVTSPDHPKDAMLHRAGEPVSEGDATPQVEVSYGASNGTADVSGNIKAWINRKVDPLILPANLNLAGIKVTFGSSLSTCTDLCGNFRFKNVGTTPGLLTASWFGACHYINITPGNGNTAWSFGALATPGVPVNIQIYSSALTQPQLAQTNCAYLVHSVNEYCRRLITGFNNAADAVTINVNVTGTCNAFMSGATINFFPAGGGCVNSAYSTVVEHEWGHHLDNIYGGISNNAFDGLSEGWGDIIAMYGTSQPLIGKNFMGSGSLRTGLNSTTYGSCSEVHCAGESWMGWAWDVRVGLNAKYASGSIFALSGGARAERLVIPTIVANATNQTGAVREVFLRDDDDSNLNNGTPNCDVLGAACTKRVIANPVTGCVGTKVAAYTSFGVYIPCYQFDVLVRPQIVTMGRPVIGSISTISLIQAPPNVPAVLWVGSSETTWGPYTLPLDLGFLGMPDNFLYTDIAINIAAVTTTSGGANVGLAIPNVPALVGGRAYFQWAVVDPTANPLGLLTTDGVLAYVGDR